LSRDELSSLYNNRNIIRLRLDRLLDSKQIVKRDGRFFIGGWLLRSIAFIVRSGKILVIGKSSEFSLNEECVGQTESVGSPGGARP
jgi:hypothetical protein